MLLHVLNLDIHTASLDLRPWIDRMYMSNDLRAMLPSRASVLTLYVERVDSEHAMEITRPPNAVFAETNLCTGRCYYHDGRFYSASDTEYWHEMEYDLDAHTIRANLGGIYLRHGQAVVSNFIRPILQSFILPFYGLKTLHGGVVSKDGHTFFLAGAGGAGKSTMAAQLMRDGFDLISDDGPFFTLDGDDARALSSLDYLHVTGTTLALFPELAPHIVGGKDNRDKYAVSRAALQRGDAWRRPLKVGTIVKLSRGAVGAPRLTPLDKQALLQALFTETMIVFRRSAFQDRASRFKAYSEFIFDVVAGVVRDVNGYQLEYANHHIADVPALLDDLARNGG